MKAQKGKIIECTEDELYAYYLRHGWDDLYPFDEYKRRCEANGTKILGRNNDAADTSDTSLEA